MQPTTLLDNLNSDLLAAFSALQPKGSPQRILVYIESDDDIPFWRNILSPFEKNGLSFDIQLPIKNALEKGKIAVLEFADRVGNNLILCVDSDYDYLLQDTTPISTLINTNHYIFQTYAYSIENLLCYSNSLHSLCTQSTKNDKRIIEFEELLKFYSKTVHKLFLWSVHFSLVQDTTSFTITDFSETIKILENAIVSEKFDTALIGLKNRVNIKIQELETRFPNKILHIEKLNQSLTLFGVEDNNVYLFVKGHIIKDNVVLMFLKPIFKHLKKQKEQEIKSNANHNEEMINQLDFYKKQIIDIEQALNANTEFKSCFLYEKIHSDLVQYVQRLQG